MSLQRSKWNEGNTSHGPERYGHIMEIPRLRALPIALAVLALMATATQAADDSEPAQIHFQNRPIATLRATVGPLTPSERVEGAEERLEDTPASDFRRPVTVLPVGDSRAILIGERMIFAITPDDVDASAGETVEGVAAVAAETLRAAIASWAEQQRPEVVLRGVTRVLIAVVLAVLVAFAIRMVRRYLLRRLPRRAERQIEKRHMTFFGQDLRATTVKALRILVDTGTVIAFLGLTYSSLTFSLKQFPLTAPWGDGLGGFLADTLQMIGLGIVRGIPEMLVVVLILVVTRLFVRLVSTLFDAVERGQVKMRGVHPDTADATRRIVTVLVWVFGIAIAYPFIPGSDTDAFKGLSVLVGIMISLGSSGVINQAMSGMVVVFSRALKAGEYVSVGEYEGTVSEVGALSTKIRTKRNEEINIPNAMLVSSTTKNYSRLATDHGVILFATVGIGYDAPWRVVHRLLIDAALRTPGLKREPAPFVRQSALATFFVEYTVNAYIEHCEARLEVLSNLHANIQDAFNEAGIQIMTPAFESQPSQLLVVPRSRWDSQPGPSTQEGKTG